MKDGIIEASLSLHLKDIIEKFWEVKNILELEDDFDLLFRYYETIKKDHLKNNEEKRKFKRYGRR